MKKTEGHWKNEADYLAGMGTDRALVPLRDDEGATAQAWEGNTIWGLKVSHGSDRAPEQVSSGRHIWGKVIMSWLGIMALLWFAFPLGFMVLAAGTLVMTVILVKLG